MESLRFEPLIPGALWMALAVAGAALLLFYAVRRRPTGVPRRRWGGIIALMVAAVALVLVVLLNPTWVREIPPPAGKPLLTLLVDASASMLTPDAEGGPRYDAALRSASKIVDDLSDRFDVRVRTFADAGAIDADLAGLRAQRPAGPATDLAAGVAGTLGEDRPQGQAVVVLSDGIHNASVPGNAPGASAASGAQRVLEAARAARSVGAPVYTRTFGSAEAGDGFDLRVEMRASQDLAFVGQRLAVTARVLSPGLSGGRANVVLLQDGAEVGRQAVDLAADRAAEARFWVTRDATGVFAYEARVEPLPGELTQANNAVPYLLRVVDQPVRVLQLEGKPYWDSKFLLRTLAAVPAVEIDSVVRVAEGRYLRRTLKRDDREQESGAKVEGTTGGPQTQPATGGPAAAKVHEWKIVGDPAEILGNTQLLKGYQVIVLGRDAEQFLNGQAMDNLQAWVAREGGSLVCYRGSPTVQAHERLARLLPVRWTPAQEARFRIKLTADGQNLQWFGGAGPTVGATSPDAPQAVLASLPTLASTAQIDRAKPLAIVLATAVTQASANGGTADASPGGTTEQPAVVYQPYGTGRVVVVEGSGMWRWAFLPPKFKGQEEVYASLWHSMVRWLFSAETLMPGQRLALRADKVSFNSTEAATATLLVRDEAAAKGKPPMVELVPGDGAPGAGEPRAFAPAPFGDEPGTFRVNFGRLPEGRYVLRVAGAPADEAFARTVFGVRTLGQEQVDLTPRPDLMARLAADSGGKVLDAGRGREIEEAFRAHMAALRPPRVERTPAWDRWWVLLGVIALWTVSWSLRRSAGLV